MTDDPVAHFYDQLADDYHLIYRDWKASMERQGASLDALIRTALGPEPASVLDCSCGIGTQAVPLARLGHQVTGADLSLGAVARAAREAALRGLALPAVAADMRQLPFDDCRFDVVVCADNALPHLLTAEDVHRALAGMRRVLRSGGLLVLSTRPYDELLITRPVSTPPQQSEGPDGRVVTFQLWHWHPDGERYDLEHFRLAPDGTGWDVAVRRSTYWALTQRQLAGLAADAGFTEISWESPERTGFFQPVLTARVP
ncbi:methyltransferase domain-containing protein [Kitasatospora sp. NPDC002040]|uniref:class I SAM-dependent methyltransferase n=1 Tax=Kitasatospora sp. NPDC002040 TaxID=3154661 RepID=UPI0033332721